jgi:hypothetical protein
MQLPFVIVIIFVGYFLLLLNICQAVPFYFSSLKYLAENGINAPPIGEHLRNVRKLSNFIGARNLRFG